MSSLLSECTAEGVSRETAPQGAELDGALNAPVEALQEAVDQITAHLALLRGGGLLLSSVDGRLLVSWLEQGVPVPLILAALEKAAERRRKRRVRTPLSMDGCKGVVKKLLESLPSVELRGWVKEEEAHRPHHEPSGGELEALACSALRSIEELRDPDPLARADRAMAIVRGFHLEAWKLAGQEHEILRTRAAQELEGLREGMEESRFLEAVEEVARDLLRQRFPLLSAASVWDRLHAG